MKTALLRVLLASALSLPLAPVLAADGRSFKAVAKDKNGKPVPGVTLSLLSSGNKFNAGVTDANGEVTVPLDLGNIPANQPVKADVRRCRHTNGTETTELLFSLSDSQIPPEKDCHDHVAVYFPWPQNDGAIVVVNLDGSFAATASATAVSGGAFSSPPLFWGSAGFGLGANRFGSLNTCGSFRSVFPGAPCHNGEHSFGFNIGGQIGISPFRSAGFAPQFALGGMYNYFLDINRKATAPSFTEHSSIHTQFETITGQIILPFGPVSIFGGGGVVFWQDYLKETQSAGTGSVLTSSHIDETSPAVEGGLQYNIARHIGIGGRFVYFQTQKPPALDGRNLAAFAEFNFRF